MMAVVQFSRGVVAIGCTVFFCFELGSRCSEVRVSLAAGVVLGGTRAMPWKVFVGGTARQSV